MNIEQNAASGNRREQLASMAICGLVSLAGLLAMTRWGAFASISAATICVAAAVALRPRASERDNTSGAVSLPWAVATAAFALAALTIASANSVRVDGLAYTDRGSYALEGIITFVATAAAASVAELVGRARSLRRKP